jgi:prephenate dehydrogenase
MDAIALRLMSEAIRAINARPIVLTAERHDHIVALISHVPQLLSTALALRLADAGDEMSEALAGAGIADMTRLAASHWSVWEDICATNGDEIAVELDRFITLLASLRDELKTGGVEQTGSAFRRASAYVRRPQSGDGPAN